MFSSSQNQHRQLEDQIATHVFSSSKNVNGEVLRCPPQKLCTTLNHASTSSVGISKCDCFCSERGACIPKSTWNCTSENEISNQIDQERTITHVLMLPGNPGVVQYYSELLRFTRRALPPCLLTTVLFHAIGLPGHDLRNLNGSNAFCISEHREYVIDYIISQRLVSPVSKKKLILVGHSYGSFLALEVLNDLPSEIISRTSLIMLMPCLWRMSECAGWFTQLFLRNYMYSTSLAVWIIRTFIPSRLLGYAVGLQKFSATAKSTTRQALGSPSISLINNICVLGCDEMEQIIAPKKYSFLPDIAHRVRVFVASGDKWCPLEAISAIKELFGSPIKIEVCGGTLHEGVEHAFVLNHNHNKIVASKLASWIADLVPM